MLTNIKQITNTCMNVISIFEKLDLLSHISLPPGHIYLYIKPPDLTRLFRLKTSRSRGFPCTINLIASTELGFTTSVSIGLRK